VTFSQVIDSI